MKKTIISILKIIPTFLLIFLTPFILPLLLKFFLWKEWFKDIEEFEKIIRMFLGKSFLKKDHKHGYMDQFLELYLTT